MKRMLAALLAAAALAALPVADAPPAAAELATAVYRTDGVEGEVATVSNAVPAHVWDIQNIGNTMYVAGRFQSVVESRGSWPRTAQPFLAAFDADSGRFIDWWRPQVNGPVWALDVTAGGALLAGGDFTEVNGQPRGSIVALDPRTGEVAPGFDAQVFRPNTTAPAVIRNFHRHGDHLYLAGNFSRVAGGGSNVRHQVTKVARVNASTGAPDPTWAPVVAGRSAWAAVVSTDGQRVHLGGEFSYVNGQDGTSQLATVSAQTGANVPGWDHGSNRSPVSFWPVGGIIYDLGVYGNNLFVSGAEHFWEVRDSRDGRQIRYVNSPHDTQRIEVIGDRVYIGCHCFRTNRGLQLIEVSGTTGNTLRNLGGSLLGGDGAWAFAKGPDACLWTGGDFRSTTEPVGGSGSWVGRFARLCDSAGPLPHNVPSLTPPPLPGDPAALINRGATWRYWADGTHPQGWTTLAHADGSWPSGPTRAGFGAGDEATTIDPVGADGRRILSAVFRRSFEVDDPADVPYLELELNADDGATVWINGQPVVAQNVASGDITAGTYATEGIFGAARREFRTYRLPASGLVAGTNVMAVSIHQNYRNSPQFTFEASLRSVDGPGGGLTSPPAITVPGQAPPPGPDPVEPTELIATGSTWRYLDDGSDQATAWRALSFGDTSWPEGPAKLGFGMGDEVTETRTGGRPVTAYFRHRFTVADAAGFSALTLRLLRDDGAVVYLNGTELVRDNMPSGPITATTNATAYVTGNGQTRFHDFTLPASALRSGDNVLAVEVHQADGSLDLAFDLALSGR